MHVVEAARHLAAAMVTHRPKLFQGLTVQNMDLLVRAIRNIDVLQIRREREVIDRSGAGARFPVDKRFPDVGAIDLELLDAIAAAIGDPLNTVGCDGDAMDRAPFCGAFTFSARSFTDLSGASIARVTKTRTSPGLASATISVWILGGWADA